MKYKVGDKLYLNPDYIINAQPCSEFILEYIDDSTTSELNYQIICTGADHDYNCGEFWYSEQEIDEKFYPKYYIEIRDMFNLVSPIASTEE